jgi:hypothetical protein
VSAIQAARAAATLRRDLGVEVRTVEGRYGELSVLVDDEKVVSTGRLGFLGILPSVRKIRDAVAQKMQAGTGPG